MYVLEIPIDINTGSDTDIDSDANAEEESNKVSKRNYKLWGDEAKKTFENKFHEHLINERGYPGSYLSILGSLKKLNIVRQIFVQCPLVSNRLGVGN